MKTASSLPGVGNVAGLYTRVATRTLKEVWPWMVDIKGLPYNNRENVDYTTLNLSNFIVKAVSGLVRLYSLNFLLHKLLLASSLWFLEDRFRGLR